MLRMLEIGGDPALEGAGPLGEEPRELLAGAPLQRPAPLRDQRDQAFGFGARAIRDGRARIRRGPSDRCGRPASFATGAARAHIAWIIAGHAGSNAAS